MDVITIAAGDPLDDALEAAAAGAVFELEAGDHDCKLVVKQDLTLRAAANLEAGEVRLVGGKGSVIHVRGAGVALVLEGVTLTGGKAELGGAVRVTGAGKVSARRCRFEGNRASAKGGALYAGDGEVVLDDCVFADNRAGEGGAIYLDGRADLTMTGGELSGNDAGRGAGIALVDGVKATLTRVTARDQAGDEVDLRVAGTLSRAPSVNAIGCTFGGEVEARPESALSRG